MASASMWIGSYLDVTTTTAAVSYSTSGWTLPQDTQSSWGDPKNGGESSSVYSNLGVTWYFSDGQTSGSWSGSHLFTGLTPGAEEYLYADASGSCICTFTSTSWTTIEIEIIDPVTGEVTIEEEYNSSSYTVDSVVALGDIRVGVTAYMRPNPWPWWDHLEKDLIIEYHILAEDWNNLITQAFLYQRWHAQSPDVNIKQCTVAPGDLITASIYNDMADNCGTGHVRGGYNGDVIVPALFKTLAWAVS